MKRLLSKRTTKIVSSTSPLTFQTTVESSWDRFIAIKGQNIYNIGNVCGTCSFYFEKLMDREKSISPKETISKLNSGLTSIDNNTIDILREIIPNGYYEIALLSIIPKQIFIGESNDYFVTEQVELWGVDSYSGVPHSPKINYYRGTDKEIGDNRKIFEFFIPLTSNEYIDQARIDFYKEQILKGNKPTAISLTILDIKVPAVWPDDDIKPEFTAHWCLAHYIIDGHHKIKAASELKSEITLLSFIATREGISTEDDIFQLLKFID